MELTTNIALVVVDIHTITTAYRLHLTTLGGNMIEPKFPNVNIPLYGMLKSFMIYYLQDVGPKGYSPKWLLELESIAHSGNIDHQLMMKFGVKISENEKLVRFGMVLGFTFCISDIVYRALFQVATFEQLQEFQNEVHYGNIDNLIKVCNKWVHSD